MRGLLAAALGITLASCTASTWEDDVEPLFAAECASCHSGSTPEADLLLDDRDALIDAPATQADMPLVSPGDHLDSYLWHKLANTQAIAGGSGSAMPQGRVLDDELVDLVGDWIDAGAP